MKQNQEWEKTRVSQNNKFIAEQIYQRTHGEDFIWLGEREHLEGRDSIPAYLQTVSQPSRVTDIQLNETEAQKHYVSAAGHGERFFTGRDFTNAPDSVLLLNGKNTRQTGILYHTAALA